MKKIQKLILIEIILGVIFVVAGIFVYIWARNLVWILIYPPPWQEQVIEIAPYFLWMTGFILIIDGIRKVIVVLRK